MEPEVGSAGRVAGFRTSFAAVVLPPNFRKRREKKGAGFRQWGALPRLSARAEPATDSRAAIAKIAIPVRQEAEVWVGRR